MLQRRVRGKIVGNMPIVLAIVLLFGVLAMTYGYFQRNMHWIYLGIPITIATSFTIMFQTILRPLNWINIRRTKRVR
jgi:ABC-type multidrug transport system permease subunit